MDLVVRTKEHRENKEYRTTQLYERLFSFVIQYVKMGEYIKRDSALNKRFLDVYLKSTSIHSNASISEQCVHYWKRTKQSCRALSRPIPHWPICKGLIILFSFV